VCHSNASPLGRLPARWASMSRRVPTGLRGQLWCCTRSDRESRRRARKGVTPVKIVAGMDAGTGGSSRASTIQYIAL